MSCVTVNVTCYTLIAVSLLQKARASRVKTGVVNRTDSSPQPGTSRQIQATTATDVSPNLHLSETTYVAVTDTNKVTAAQAKNATSLSYFYFIHRCGLRCAYSTLDWYVFLTINLFYSSNTALIDTAIIHTLTHPLTHSLTHSLTH